MTNDEMQRELDRIKHITTGGALELLKTQIEIEKIKVLQSINNELEQLGTTLAVTLPEML